MNADLSTVLQRVISLQVDRIDRRASVVISRVIELQPFRLFSPNEFIYRPVHALGEILGFSASRSVGITINSENIPLIGLVARLLLRPIGQFLAIRRKARRAIGRLVAGGQVV